MSRKVPDFFASPLHVTARWDRNVVANDGGTANLLITISAKVSTTRRVTRSPLDIAFVLDRSGSMAGEKLQLAKEATLTGISILSAEDRAAAVIFDHEVETLHNLSFLDSRSKARVQRVMRPIDAGGSTNLSGGWLTGCDQLASGPTSGRARLRRAILLTDGQANLGIVDPGELMNHAAELRKRGISTTTIGIGADFDEVLLGGMAEAGGGAFQYIERPSQLRGFFEEELETLLSVVASGVAISLTLPHGVRAELANGFPVERTGKRLDVSIGDVSAGNPLQLVFNVSIRPGSIGNRHAVAASIAWSDPENDQSGNEAIPVETLKLVERHEADLVQPDREVAEEVAVQVVSAREREAMRLDREGRHPESRSMMAMSADMLQAAPSSARVLALHSHFSLLAEEDESIGYASETRKQSTSDAMRRSRGRKAQPDTPSS